MRRPERSQVGRTIGPAWTKRGRPEDGTYTRRTAEQALDLMLNALEAEANRPPTARVTFGMAVNE